MPANTALQRLETTHAPPAFRSPPFRPQTWSSSCAAAASSPVPWCSPGVYLLLPKVYLGIVAREQTTDHCVRFACETTLLVSHGLPLWGPPRLQLPSRSRGAFPALTCTTKNHRPTTCAIHNDTAETAPSLPPCLALRHTRFACNLSGKTKPTR